MDEIMQKPEENKNNNPAPITNNNNFSYPGF
jgi:hypothetical protein